MAQSNITLNCNVSGLTYTNNLNNALAAMDSSHSGITAPTLNVVAGKFWLDTSGGSPILKIQSNGWKSLFTLNSTTVDMSINNITGNTITGVNVNTTSDERLKKDIQELTFANEKVKQLKGVSYTLKESGEQTIGLIAQQVEEVLPEVVSTNEDGYKSISYGNIVALLIEALKEQDKRIQELEAKLV
jgi:hypothetical protein